MASGYVLIISKDYSFLCNGAENIPPHYCQKEILL